MRSPLEASDRPRACGRAPVLFRHLYVRTSDRRRLLPREAVACGQSQCSLDSINSSPLHSPNGETATGRLVSRKRPTELCLSQVQLGDRHCAPHAIEAYEMYPSRTGIRSRFGISLGHPIPRVQLPAAPAYSTSKTPGATSTKPPRPPPTPSSVVASIEVVRTPSLSLYHRTPLVPINSKVTPARSTPKLIQPVPA